MLMCDYDYKMKLLIITWQWIDGFHPIYNLNFRLQRQTLFWQQHNYLWEMCFKKQAFLELL
jgi:hypothetical protein